MKLLTQLTSGLMAVFLSACTAPLARTDLVEAHLVLDIVPYAEMVVRCPYLSQACYADGKIVMQSYGGKWPEGSYALLVPVQYLLRHDIDAKCGAPVCQDAGQLYTYDYSIADVAKMGYVGQELVAMLNLPPNQINAEQILGHEFWHALGHPDIHGTDWSVK